jgi:hypothetical protein
MNSKQTDVDPTNGRKRELSRALYEDRKANGAVMLTTEQRTAYERELAWYRRHPEASEQDWRVYEYQRAQLNSEAKRERLAREAEQKALNEKNAKEAEERLRAKIAEEQDPLNVYRRQHSERTF